MGSSSSRVSEDGASRRSFRDLGLFSSSCFGIPITTSDQKSVERHSRSKAIAFTADNATYESCGEMSVNQCSETTMNTDDQNRDMKTLMRQCDPGCSNSRAPSLTDQSSNQSCCLHRLLTFIPERAGFKTCKAKVVKSLGNNVSSAHDDRLGSRIECPENRVENNQHNNRNNAHTEASLDECSHINLQETENIDTTNHCSRRQGSPIPLEGSMRFSRTRSVGRLRDRVLRRNALSEDLFGALLMEERSLIRSNSQIFSRQTIARTSNSTNENLYSHVDGSIPSSQLLNLETSQIRDTGNRDLFEHRSAFLERRRRIRSQVRALQRLGSRFENLSGHDRTCILSGQRRTGQCSCRSSNRPPNSNNDTNSSTSISRIVMLAEALFEVLDEIHQQSAVLSTRQSISSLGSVPAPKEVVDNIPMKVYAKSKARFCQEVPQCYICLVEYEDGEFIRTLPCHHEFHQTCIDKWLKEIHRVCPVCRGNVCR